MDDAEFNLLLDKAAFSPQTNSFVELYRQKASSLLPRPTSVPILMLMLEKPAQNCCFRYEALQASDTEDWLKLEVRMMPRMQRKPKTYHVDKGRLRTSGDSSSRTQSAAAV
jgi:hypothetical protein